MTYKIICCTLVTLCLLLLATLFPWLWFGVPLTILALQIYASIRWQGSWRVLALVSLLVMVLACVSFAGAHVLSRSPGDQWSIVLGLFSLFAFGSVTLLFPCLLVARYFTEKGRKAYDGLKEDDNE